MGNERTVGQVAALVGVTVRALHHFDEIGLVAPRGRAANGYRLYGDEDVLRLQRALAYRELGLPLHEIRALLDDPDADPAAHLRRQHALLRAEVGRLQGLVVAIETELEGMDVGISLTPEERAELFGDWRPEEHEAEAQERWGETDAWAQSRRRTASYTADDWRAIKAEGADAEHQLASALAAGEPAGGVAAMAAAEAHRQQIVRWFYDCPPEMHRGLGEMYVADERFTAYYERIAPGLAAYARDAIAANADRLAAG